MDESLFDILVCPRDQNSLRQEGDVLVCAKGHQYPIVEGVPILLLDDVEQTIGIARASLQLAGGEIANDSRAPEFYLPSVGISDLEKEGVIELARRGSAIDPVVAHLVGATNGLMYKHLIGSLYSYPIPDIPVQEGHGKKLLDLGCSWGRWSIAAARKGYDVVGIDPSLGAIKAAQRVARELGVIANFVVADARFLPFRDEAFDSIFSYSVIQHLSPADAAKVVAEIGRALIRSGEATIQMPTTFGVRCLYHQARRRFREARGFQVRYWRLSELKRLFEQTVGATHFSADCFFGIGLQKSDLSLMPPSLRAVTHFSEMLKGATRKFPALVHAADSVFVRSTRSAGPANQFVSR
jgi:SAM-dependent methyltransferase/uncharacterized protein YbaR (Trm112 family)